MNNPSLNRPVRLMLAFAAAGLMASACAGPPQAVLGTVTVTAAAAAGGGRTLTTTATETVTVTATPTSESTAPAAPTAPTTAAPAAGAAGTTRDQPVPIGTPATVGDWSITVEPTNTNAADVVAAENSFNDPAAAGRQFVMVKVNATYNGSGSENAGFDLRVVFVGSAGNTFGSGLDDDCGVIPAPMFDAGDVFTGAVASGNECASVPAEQIPGGVWSIEAGFNSDPAYFASA